MAQNDFLHDPYDLLGKNPSRKRRKSDAKTHNDTLSNVKPAEQTQDFYILRDDSL